MNVCACMGASGKDPYCPCEMKRRGLKVSITETCISHDVWDSMDDEDKRKINDLKSKAAFKWMFEERLL
jgi:hypothetical protein